MAEVRHGNPQEEVAFAVLALSSLEKSLRNLAAVFPAEEAELCGQLLGSGRREGHRTDDDGIWLTWVEMRVKNRFLIHAKEVEVIKDILRREECRVMPDSEFNRLVGEMRQASSASQAQKIRHRLLCSNLRLVVVIAKEFWDPRDGLEMDDLVISGYLGLELALAHFDPSKGVPFGNFAPKSIRIEIRKGKRKLGTRYFLSVPPDQQGLVAKVSSLQLSLSDALSPEQIDRMYEEMGKGCRRRRVSKGSFLKCLEMASWKGTHNKSDLWGMVPGAGPDPEECCLEKEQVKGKTAKEWVEVLKKTLSPSHFHLLEARFGLVDDEPQTYQAVADALGVKRQAVQQKEARILKGLQERFKDP